MPMAGPAVFSISTGKSGAHWRESPRCFVSIWGFPFIIHKTVFLIRGMMYNRINYTSIGESHRSSSELLRDDGNYNFSLD